MWRKSLNILFLLIAFASFSQKDDKWLKNPFKKSLDVSIKKTGPYVGLQRGKYTVLELGAERQYKQIKLKTARTHAFHMGFSYNFKYNVLGYEAGYWIKPSRIGLTFGANLVFRTDFDRSRIGIAPVVGYKLFGFHLQTGYHFLTGSNSFETNTFFVSLRFVLIRDRDVDMKRKKK